MPEQIAGKGRPASARRFAVYRNNVYASLVDVLAGRYPVVARLVGEEFFRAMARLHVAQEPPRSPVLLRYGRGFPDFVASFAPAATVPYLADVARLEWSWHEAYHAADAEPVPLEQLMAAARHAEDLRLGLHPSLQVLRSEFPVVTIWERNMRDESAAGVRIDAAGEDALVLRPHLDVEVRRLPPGGAAFVAALRDGHVLINAAEIAISDAPHFDLQANLLGLVRAEAIVGLERRAAAS